MGRCSVMVVLFLLGCGHVLGGSSGGDLGGLGGRLASVPDGTSVKMLFTVGVRRGVVTRVGEGRRRFAFSLWFFFFACSLLTAFAVPFSLAQSAELFSLRGL